MKDSHKLVLKEITDEVELSMISGGAGSGDWVSGAMLLWGTIVGISSGKSCSWPGGFYSNPTPTGSGVCTAPGWWNASAGRECYWDSNDINDICY